MATPEEQRGYEDHLLVEFCGAADQANVEIPGDRPELRDPRRALKDHNPFEFPPIEKLHMAALAQHYGIPTRLLDWTRHPFVAAYFAAEQIAKIQGNKYRPRPEIQGKGSCAVWALDQGLIEEIFRSLELDPTIRFVTAPHATNPNLAGPGGDFERAYLADVAALLGGDPG